MSDEHGNWLRGDIVGLLCARYLEVKHLAVPVSCNTAIEHCGFFESVIRTRIGSPYVIAAMQNFEDNSSAIAGFEANGGFLLGSPIMHEGKTLLPLPTRDAVLPALAVLAAAREAGVAVSTLVKALPDRYTASDRLQNIPTNTSKHLLDTWAAQPALFCEMMNQGYKISEVDLTDGLRMTLDSQNIIHLRPSGNAPELRCYCEAATPESAELMTQMVLARIAQEVDLTKA
jgi:phosphomannomutase